MVSTGISKGLFIPVDIPSSMNQFFEEGMDADEKAEYRAFCAGRMDEDRD